MKMSNEIYDILKDIAQLWLPGLATLYAALAVIWGLPFSSEIPATIMAIDTFLGGILKISTVKYNNAKEE